jgi:hypothetical protein
MLPYIRRQACELSIRLSTVYGLKGDLKAQLGALNEVLRCDYMQMQCLRATNAPVHWLQHLVTQCLRLALPGCLCPQCTGRLRLPPRRP